MRKKYFFMTVLILASAIVMARVQAIFSSATGEETNDHVSITVPNELYPGDEFYLSISLENANTNYTAFQMDIVAPQGMSFVEDYDEDGEWNYVYAYNKDRKKSDHIMSCNYFQNSNTLRLAGYSSSNKTYNGTEGEFLTVKMKINDSYKNTYKLQLTNVSFTDTTPQDYYLDDVTFELTTNDLPLPEGSEFQPAKIYYLYNVGARKYFCAGNSWGTQASVSDTPLCVNFTPYENADGVYTLNNFFRSAWMQCFFDSESSLYVDRANQSDYGWKVVKVGDFYRLQAADDSVNPDLNSTVYPDTYVGLDITDNPNNTALSPFLSEGNGHFIDWLLLEVDTSITGWTSSNHENSSSETRFWTVEQDESIMLRFDWSVSSESGCDYLRIWLDNELIVQASGEESGSYEKYFDAGYHVLTATYSKDGSVNNGSDLARVYNIAFGGLEELIEQNIEHVLEIIESNQEADPQLKEEALAYVDDIRNGNYDKTKGLEVISQLQHYAQQLSALHLDIYVPVAGSLGDSILTRNVNFNEVVSLRVSGNLNNTDLQQIKDLMSNLQYLDMGETNVTSIPNELFRSKNMLETIVLPKNLTAIGNYAFAYCNNLREAALPATLQTIGERAFYNCSLAQVEVPEGVTSIGNYAYACDNNAEYAYDINGNYQYDQYGNYVYYYPYAKLTSVSLPGTLTTLGYAVFMNQHNLTSVVIEDGLTSLPSDIFVKCTALTDVRLPNTLTSINSYAFSQCTSLQRIEIPDQVTTIYQDAFANCSSLVEVTLPSSLEAVYYPFRYCQKLTRMTCKAIVPPYADNSIMNGLESQCTLYVPILSINVYKQTPYWYQFNIEAADILPESIVITEPYKLNWPDDISMSYKPNVRIGQKYTNSSYRYGSLEVNGNSTLSAGEFTIVFDPNQDRSNNSGWNTRPNHKNVRYASLINNANVRADNVTVELWTKTNEWTFISIPFDVKVGDIRRAFDAPFAIRKYDGEMRAQGQMENTWVNMTNDDILQAGQGYILQSPSLDNRNYDGFYLDALQNENKNKIFLNDNAEVELAEYQSEFPQNRSWNLIGNPYPCFFDARAIDVTAPIIVWNAYNWNYEAYSPIDDQLILKPGEAFFIQRPVDQASITFLKEGRQADLEIRDISYFAQTRQSDMTAQRSVFNILLTNGEQGDHTRFVINPEAVTGYEQGLDASKFMGENAPVQLYTLEQGVRYAINERPLGNDNIRLGVKLQKKGTFTITLDTRANDEVILIDHLTGTEVLLGEEGYTFVSEAGTFENRFEIRLGLGETTGIQEVNQSASAADTYHNLNGVRVLQPQKGLYINNGKKVVVK